MAESTTEINHVLRVSPPTSNSLPKTESTLPLTFFDTFWIKFPPVERVFFYKLTDLTHEILESDTLPKLKHSLSLTLLHYPPLVGTIKWPETDPIPSIFYSSTDGVPLKVATSTSDFDTLSSNRIQPAKGIKSLVPELITCDDFAELISIQITLFPNRGFSIGVTTHHAIFDGKSSTNFIKSWAYICKTEQSKSNLPTELTPSFDRRAISDTTIAVSFIQKWFDLGGKFKSDSDKDIDNDISNRSLKVFPFMGSLEQSVRGTFNLTRSDLKRLREYVNKYAENESKEIHLSTFVLTFAYVFTSMVRARGGEVDREVIMGFTADYRSRVKPPLSENYFGNCVATQLVFTKAGEIMEEKTGVFYTAEILSGMVKGMERRGAVDGLNEFFEAVKMVKPGLQGLGTAGSNRFGVYGIDFGWGRPEKVEIVSVDRTGSVAMAESRDGSGGVEVGLVLEKVEMERFGCLFSEGLMELYR